jgi:hypothetical protein
MTTISTLEALRKAILDDMKNDVVKTCITSSNSSIRALLEKISFHSAVYRDVVQALQIKFSLSYQFYQYNSYTDLRKQHTASLQPFGVQRHALRF